MRVPVEPRPLTTKERAVVERILQLDFPGAAELRHRLIGFGWWPCGDPILQVSTCESRMTRLLLLSRMGLCR